MTARVAAQYAHTSPWTIRRNVTACGRRGRSFVYSIDDIDRWMRGAPVAVLVVGQESGRRRDAPVPMSVSIARIRALAKRSSGDGQVADAGARVAGSGREHP